MALAATDLLMALTAGVTLLGHALLGNLPGHGTGALPLPLSALAMQTRSLPLPLPALPTFGVALRNDFATVVFATDSIRT